LRIASIDHQLLSGDPEEFFRTASLVTLPSISIVFLLSAGGSTPVMSFSTQRISWNLGAADEPTQDNSAVTYR
jgi:hypothetical protein